MTSSTALSLLNYALAGLWDYVYTTLTSGGVIYFVIAITVLFVGIHWGLKLLHHK